MLFISDKRLGTHGRTIVGRDSVLEQARQAFRNLEKAMEALAACLPCLLKNAVSATMFFVRPKPFVQR